MLKVLLSCLLVVSLNALTFPIDASYCVSSAKKLKYSAEELEDLESRVQSAESDYEAYCGYGGISSKDEYSCGDYGTYKTEYEDSVSAYNSLLSDVQYNLKRVLRNCQ